MEFEIMPTVHSQQNRLDEVKKAKQLFAKTTLTSLVILHHSHTLKKFG